MKNLLTYQGSNGYKRRIKIDFLGGSTSIFVCYVLVVLWLLIVFSVAKAVREKQDWLKEAVNLQAHAAELQTMPELASVQERTEVIALIKRVWGKDAETGLAIARCESGYRANARNLNTNGTVDEGVFQANSVHGMPDMTNATANILYAYNLYKEQGTAPWLSSAHCWKGLINEN